MLGVDGADIREMVQRCQLLKHAHHGCPGALGGGEKGGVSARPPRQLSSGDCARALDAEVCSIRTNYRLAGFGRGP